VREIRRMADYLCRLNFVVLDELGYLPFAQSGGQLLFHLISRLYEQTSVIMTTTWHSANGQRLRRRQNDRRSPRSSDPPLRHRRDGNESWRFKNAPNQYPDPRLAPMGPQNPPRAATSAS